MNFALKNILCLLWLNGRGFLFSDVSVEMPVILMHPKPPESKCCLGSPPASLSQDQAALGECASSPNWNQPQAPLLQ